MKWSFEYDWDLRYKSVHSSPPHGYPYCFLMTQRTIIFRETIVLFKKSIDLSTITILFRSPWRSKTRFHHVQTLALTIELAKNLSTLFKGQSRLTCGDSLFLVSRIHLLHLSWFRTTLSGYHHSLAVCSVRRY